MYTISKEFHFSAGHHLEGLPKEHPCSTFHGHNYIVIVELEAEELDGPGFVLDYRALEPIKKFIDSTLDHKDLNVVLSFNPTAENIAKYIFEKVQELFTLMYVRSGIKLSSVSVKETDKTLAKYRA